MFYLETPEGFRPWAGGLAADGNIYPRDYPEHATPAELLDAGLFEPADPGVPDGKRKVSRSVARVGGVVTVVYELEDITPPTPSDVDLTDRQLRIGLLVAGYDLGVVDVAIEAIADPIDRAVARVWWERTTVIQWGHPMTQQIMGLAGIPENERATLWIWASDIAA
jgi:hypothetical protein